MSNYKDFIIKQLNNKYSCDLYAPNKPNYYILQCC